MSLRALGALTLLAASPAACAVEERAIYRIARDAGGCVDACACPTTFAPPTGELRAWFDASCLPLGPLRRWRDASGAGRDAVQDEEDAAPVVRTGGGLRHRAVYFDGTRRFLRLPDGTAPTPNGAYTVFVAGSWDNVRTTYNGVLGWGGLQGVHLLVNPGGHAYQWFGPDSESGVALPGVPDAAPAVITWVYASAGRRAPGSLAVYINGSAMAFSAARAPSDAESEEITLGRAPDHWGTNNPMLGYLGEVLVYARALSADEIRRVNEHLVARWVR